jgi:hypothetical protein
MSARCGRARFEGNAISCRVILSRAMGHSDSIGISRFLSVTVVPIKPCAGNAALGSY